MFTLRFLSAQSSRHWTCRCVFGDVRACFPSRKRLNILQIQGVANVIVLDGDVAGGGSDSFLKDFPSLRPLGVQSKTITVSHYVAISATRKTAGRKTDATRLPKEKDIINDRAKVGSSSLLCPMI